jgi:hypothetical protein
MLSVRTTEMAGIIFVEPDATISKIFYTIDSAWISCSRP